MSDPLAALRTRLAAHGVDVLVLRPSPDFHYVTGLRPRDSLAIFLVVTPDGVPTLVTDPAEQAARQAAALGLRIAPALGPAAAYALLGELIPAGSRVGIDPQMPARELLALQERLRPQTLLASAGPLLHPLRQRKTDAEVAALERAATAADRVVVAATELSWSGATEDEMARRLHILLLEAGQDVGSVLVAAGENSADPYHVPSDRVINPGDVVLLQLTGRAAPGYHSRTTRMLVVAEPPDDFEALYSVVRSAQSAACEAVRPGVTAAQIHAVAAQVIADSGYTAFATARSGHGIGLDSTEPPALTAADDTPVTPGTALAVGPAIYLPDLYGAKIEEVVVCTELGSRRLNQAPRLLTVVDT